MKSNEWKLGMSSCGSDFVDRSVLEQYAKGNIECMEISMLKEQCLKLDWKQLKKDADECGVTLWSFHLPFYPFETNNFAHPDPVVRKNTLELHSEFVKHCGEIGIGIVVAHPSGEPNPAEQREEMLKYAQDTLSKLADVGAKEGVVVAVEDLPRTCIGNCSKDINFILSGNDKLRCCFDTNHLLFEDNLDFIKAVGSKIVTIHASDYDGKDEKHWLPYEGINDWVGILTELEKVGYTGPFMYEVGFKKPRALDRRELTYEDFRKNYLAVVNKQKAERIPYNV